MLQQFRVIGRYSDGTQMDVTSHGTTFDIADTSVATVTPFGLVRPVASGMTTLTAVIGKLSALAAIRVDVLTTITGTSPYSGEGEVNVFRETVVDFLNPVQTVPATAVSAVAAAQPIGTRTVLSTSRKRLFVFYNEQLPGNAEVAVTVDGSQILDNAGLQVDADADHTPGGRFQFSYTTLSLTPIRGTRVMGTIYASELLPDGMNTPLGGVRISVEGLPSVFALTDNMGNYTLENTPAGTFFVHIDGGTEVTTQGIDGPLSYYYPTLNKPFPGVRAGQDNVMPNIYLPKVKKADLQRNIDVSQEIVITSSDPRLAGIEIRVPPGSLLREDGQPVTFVGVGAVEPNRLPGPLPPGVSPPVVFTFQTDATNLMSPAAVRFPNLENLPPGAESALFSFNHDSGRFEIAGTMVVDPGAQYLLTIAGAGIPAPGWHFTAPGSQTSGFFFCLRRVLSDARNIRDFGQAAVTCVGSLIENASRWVRIARACGNSAVDLLSLADDLRQAYVNNESITNLRTIVTSLNTIKPAVVDCVAEVLSTSPVGQLDAALDCLEASLSAAANICDRMVQIGSCPPSWMRIVCIGLHIVRYATTTVNTFRDLAEEYQNQISRVTLVAVCSLIDLIVAVLDAVEPLRDGQVPPELDALTIDLVTKGNLLREEMEFLETFAVSVEVLFADVVRTAGETESVVISLTAPIVPNAYFLLVSSRGEVRGRTTSAGEVIQIVPASTQIQLMIYDPLSMRLASEDFVSARAGRPTEIGPFRFDSTLGMPDSDSDGLVDEAEVIIGLLPTNPDSDCDGIPDGEEVLAGTDPVCGFDGLNCEGIPCGSAATGVVAAIDTPGFAHEVCVKDDRAIVADGLAGISVFNVFQAQSPVLVARVDTPGTAVDADCEGSFIAVADAAAGLAIIDISTPNAAAIIHQVPLPGGAQARCVTVVLGIAYVGDSVGRVHLVEIVSGAHLGSLTLNSAHSVDDLGVSNQNLFALTTASSGGAGTLYALSITPGLPAVVGQISAPHSNERTGPFPRRRMSVGIGRVLANEFGGVQAFNTSNPAAMSQICLDIQLAAVRGVAETGSGRMILAAGAAGDCEAQVYSNFPPSCGTFQTLYQTPGNAHGVGLNNGLAYFADGEAGLQIVNFLSTDVQGIPPTGTLSVAAIPSGDVTEGGRVRLLAEVADDVQIRNVEFRVNGRRVNVDGNYPFEFLWPVPLNSAGSTVTFTAIARDTGGNALELGPIEQLIVADTQPPTISITSPANNGAFFVGDDLLVILSASDNVRIISYGFQIDGVPVSAIRRSLTTWLLPLPQSPAAYELTATATDSAGLTGVSQVVNLRVLGQAISREVSVLVEKPPPAYLDAVSREVSVLVEKPPPQYSDAISREVSVYVESR